MPAKLWLEAADEAMDKEFHGQYDIWGGDIDPRRRGAGHAQRGAGRGGGLHPL